MYSLASQRGAASAAQEVMRWKTTHYTMVEHDFKFDEFETLKDTFADEDSMVTPDSEWPFWQVKDRMWDVDTRTEKYHVVWKHPVTGEKTRMVTPTPCFEEQFESADRQEVLERKRELKDEME